MAARWDFDSPTGLAMESHSCTASMAAIITSSGFAKSKAPGFHHCSWDVPSVNDVELAAMQLADKGYSAGWGLGRHVLGSNYFHYVRDPWGNYCEYSSDIDYIRVDCDWDAADHPPEDFFYLWGPEAPKDLTTKYESGIPPVVGTE